MTEYPDDPDEILKMIEETKSEISSTSSHLENLRRTLMVQKIKFAKAKFGIEVGSVVKPTGKRWTGLFRVSQIMSQDYGKERKPWVMGNPLRKDGEFGKKEVHLFSDWELDESEPQTVAT